MATHHTGRAGIGANIRANTRAGITSTSTGLAAGAGLLIRDRAAFERARRLDAVIFDKTGTLTEGRFAVTDLISFGDNEWMFRGLGI